jgi:hypothetical protein
MAEKLLLQQLEEVASKIRLLERDKGEAAARIEALEREKNEAVVKTRALEREVGEMAALITQAGEKVDEILKIEASDDVSQPQAATVPAKSKLPRQLGEFSADPLREAKGRFPRAFALD